jgi:hypothetical protein
MTGRSIPQNRKKLPFGFVKSPKATIGQLFLERSYCFRPVDMASPVSEIENWTVVQQAIGAAASAWFQESQKGTFSMLFGTPCASGRLARSGW